MIRLVILVGHLLCFTLPVDAGAQTVQDDINRDVWFPFMKAYEKLDAAHFMSLHSRDLMRVELDEHNARNYEEYALFYRNFFSRFRKSGEAIRIRFAFTHRIVEGNRALEKGFYEFTLKSDKADLKTYGAFTVILRKEQGQWKILVDSDTNKEMSEALFQSGKLLPEPAR